MFELLNVKEMDIQRSSPARRSIVTYSAARIMNPSEPLVWDVGVAWPFESAVWWFMDLVIVLC